MPQKVKWHGGTLVLAVVLAIVAVSVFHIGQHGQSGFDARMPTAEFLYLDGPKILNLLSQLEGGEVGEVHRLSKVITHLDAKATTGPLEVGADTQYENAAESSLTRNEASELDLLIADLQDNHRPGVSYENVTLGDRSDLSDLKEGRLVRFETDDLLSPGYIRPYVVLRQSATLTALFPGNENKTERKYAERFVRQIGPDPRLTFAISPPTPNAETAWKVLLPMSYHGLTPERSLLERDREAYSGGKLVVFGEVIRVFPKPSDPSCEEEPRCLGGPEYTDFATREIWRAPLQNASSFLIARTGHTCLLQRSEKEEENYFSTSGPRVDHRVPPIEGRDCLLRKLNRQTEVFAPGAVIVPIAIYKGI